MWGFEESGVLDLNEDFRNVLEERDEPRAVAAYEVERPCVVVTRWRDLEAVMELLWDFLGGVS